MYLIKPKLSNRIKTISIENCKVKINDNHEIEKKILVVQIQKIYLKVHKQNVFLIYFCLIALISGLIVFYYSFKEQQQKISAQATFERLVKLTYGCDF